MTTHEPDGENCMTALVTIIITVFPPTELNRIEVACKDQLISANVAVKERLSKHSQIKARLNCYHTAFEGRTFKFRVVQARAAPH